MTITVACRRVQGKEYLFQKKEQNVHYLCLSFSYSLGHPIFDSQTLLPPLMRQSGKHINIRL